MVNICVFSDSHGCAEHMITAAEREKPAFCFFLGDGERDLYTLYKRFPKLPVYAVRGNCDLRSVEPYELSGTIDGAAIFAVHGHRHNVKYEPDLDTLVEAARQARASVALFGHTHVSRMERRGELLLLNPGTIGQVAHPSYGLLLVDGGKVQAKIVQL